MNSNRSYKFNPGRTIDSLVSDEWRSRTYGEYLLDCSKKQGEYIAAVSSILADDDLSDTIDSMVDECDAHYNIILDKGATYLKDLHVVDPSAYNVHSEAFTAVMNLIFRREDYDQDAFDWLKTHYPESYTYGMTGEQFLAANPEAVIKRSEAIALAIQAKYEQAMESIGVDPDHPVTLNAGYITGSALIPDLVKAALFTDHGDALIIHLQDINGDAVADATYSLASFLEEKKESMASALAWGYGFLSSARDNISTAITEFDAKVGQVISDVKERFASSIANVRSLLADTAGSVSNFFSSAYEQLGWKAFVDEAFSTVSETDVASYTGASPLSAINIKCLGDAVYATAKTVMAAGYAIFQKLKEVVTQKIWPKLRPIFAALTSNPEDIKIINDKDDSYTVSNWSMTSGTGGQSTMISGQFCGNQETYLSRARRVIAAETNKWVSIDTYFGCVQFRLLSSTAYDDPSWSGALASNVEYRFKPKCINPRTAYKYGVASLYGTYDEYQWTGTHRDWQVLTPSALWAGQQSFYDKVRAMFADPAAYCQDSDTEDLKACGFSLANLLFANAILGVCKYISEGSGPAFSDVLGTSAFSATTWTAFVDLNTTSPAASAVPYSYYSGSSRCVTLCSSEDRAPGNVTNHDFLEITSGYHEVNGYHEFNYCFSVGGSNYPVTSRYVATDPVNIGYAISALVKLFLLARCDRDAYPDDYLFLPFTTNSWDLPEGRYAIKTDAENSNIAEALALVITVAVVVAIGVVLFKTVSRIISKRKYMKWTAVKGELDNAMWNSVPLTSAQKRKYQRAERKLATMTSATSGLTGAASNTASIMDSVNSVRNSLSAMGNPSYAQYPALVSGFSAITNLISG